MIRRQFIALAGGMILWPLEARGQQSMAVIGCAVPTTVKQAGIFLARIRKGLAEYGFVEGQNFRFEFREANGQFDLLPILYRELANQKVNVIIANSTVQLEAAKGATQSIPIVFNIGVDPVENGFVASLNKPGGNITGTFNLAPMLIIKELEILHELVPSVTTFALLTDTRNTTLSKISLAYIQAAAGSLGLSLLNVNAHAPDEFEVAFETAVRAGAGGMVAGSDQLFGAIGHVQLAKVAARYKLPTIYFYDTTVRDAEGLIAYGTDQSENDRLVGGYAGRILKGEKPADMPVTQPSKTILIINLKTAKALGITVPITLLGRADELIE
jgi:putative ABC transport system substrate-binding protein